MVATLGAPASPLGEMVEAMRVSLTDLGEQFGTERALADGRRTALTGDLLGDLRPDLVPESAGARRREGLHLQRRIRIVEPDRDDALRALLHFEAKVESLAGQHLHAAEVDVRTNRVRLGLVERPGDRAVVGG